MGYVKSEISKLIKENKGKKIARSSAEEWFQKALKSRKDKSVDSQRFPFQPGKIYVFDYGDPLNKETLDWWDTNPVVLALRSIDKETDCGINLNLLPVKFKEDFLDAFYTMHSGQIKAGSTGAKKNDAFKQTPLMQLDYEHVKKFLDRFGFGFAIRRYKVNKKRNQSIVSYESWPKIALCDFIQLNGVTVMGIRALFRQYYTKRNI
jgi:hypothetical protein